MKLRPDSVPNEATCAENEGWWYVGELRDGHPFGAWRTFRADGTPLFEARFDSKGRLQGTYKRFHPDGSVAREATYAAGKPTGEHVYVRATGASGDFFPSGDARVHRIVVQHDDAGKERGRLLLDERGREVGAAPNELHGTLDGEFASASPDGFLESGAFARVLATFPRAEPMPADDLLLPVARPQRRAITPGRFQDLYGRAMPPALRAWTEAMATNPKLLGVRAVADEDLVGSGNYAEALIAEHQRAPGRASALRELGSGVYPIAQTADGRERYVLALCEASNGQPTDAVYVVVVATEQLVAPDARSLDDFAYAIALTSAASAGAVSRGALKPAYERLRGRVDLRLPMRALEQDLLADADDDEIEGDEERDHRAGFHFRRGQQLPPHYAYRWLWVLRLLRGHAEAAAEMFDLEFEGGLSDERFANVCKSITREPFVALYWLFRSLAFQDPRLDQLLAIAADSASLIVRDIAALVRELAGGRKQLGDVADFADVLSRFRALDPASNGKQDEAASEGDDEGDDSGGDGDDDDDDDDDDDEDDDDEDDDDGDDDEADEGDDDGAAVAKSKSRPKAERPPVPPELASAVAVIDWAAAQGFSRENLRIDDERDAAGLGLALRADPRVLPFLIHLADQAPWIGAPMIEPWLDGDRADLAELAAAARRWLETERDVHLWATAGAILERAGTPADAALLAKPLEEAFDALWAPKQGFDHAITMSMLSDSLEPMCRAIGKLGVPDSFVPALVGVVDAETHIVDDERGPCAQALAAAGKGLDAIVSGVRRQLAKGHGHRITAGQVLAIGELGKHEPEAKRAELVELLQSIKEPDDELGLAHTIALHDLGQSVAVAAAVKALLDAERYSASDTAKQRVFALGFVERRPDVSGELALPFVLDHELTVHRAAVRALRAKGLAVPPFTLYDPMHVAELAARGRDAIHAGLDDKRGLYRSNLALWIGDHPDPSSRDALVAAARRVAADPAYGDDGPIHYELRWTVRALLAIGGADACLNELLKHGNRDVAEPLLRYPDRLPVAVASGMAHVFVNDEHWRKSTAKSWLVKHRTDPAIAAGLAEHGLEVEDIARAAKEDE
ncbi:MAG TPA: hypothetical protein VMJ10_29450 [Kofleriaceae bacterium]|nr:hypothetical protein [Kofleriaceae bacterium]